MDELTNISAYLAGGAVVIALVALLVSEYRKRVAKKATLQRRLDEIGKAAAVRAAATEAEAVAKTKQKKKRMNRGG